MKCLDKSKPLEMKIPGYDRYYINQLGQVYHERRKRALSLSRKGQVTIYNGKEKDSFAVGTLMAATYFNVPEGYVLHHRNKLRLDFSITNLVPVPLSVAASVNNIKKSQRRIYRIDPKTKKKTVFKSAREAARNTTISRGAITDCANHKYKFYIAASDGYIYEWEKI